MRALIGVLAVTAIYFLIVWLTAIRRGGQQATKWVIQVLLQGASVYLFILMGRNSVMWMALLAVSILYIFAVNLMHRETKAAAPAPAAMSFVPVIDLDEIEDFASGRDVRETNTVGVSKAETLPADAAAPAPDGEENRMFDMIRNLVEAGQKEDAVKYLRMVAFYEKDPAVAEKAKELLAQLQN